MTTFALDTNIVSLILKQKNGVFSFIDVEIAKGNTYVIPPVVYYEAKRGLLAANASAQLKLFEEICLDFSVGEMSLPMWDKAAELHAQLRSQGLPIGDADIFIAAFCLAGDYTLVTHNTRHFERIAGLRYTDLAVD